jgi:hypothetical protein
MRKPDSKRIPPEIPYEARSQGGTRAAAILGRFFLSKQSQQSLCGAYSIEGGATTEELFGIAKIVRTMFEHFTINFLATFLEQLRHNVREGFTLANH